MTARKPKDNRDFLNGFVLGCHLARAEVLREFEAAVDSGARCNGFMKTVFGRLCQAL